jgi:hypothetical protein
VRAFFFALLVACGARSELDGGDASTTIDAASREDVAADDAMETTDARADAADAEAGACDGGPCVVALAKGPATALAVDDTTIYWTNAGACSDPTHCNGTVSKAPKNGGETSVLAVGLPFPRPIAVDATRIYVGTNFALLTIPIGGGLPAIFVPLTVAASIALDDDDVYWTNYFANTVMRAPLDGGAPVTLATDQSFAQGIAIDAVNVYWAVPGTEPTGYTDGWIAKVPIAGGTTTTIATSQLFPDGIAVAGAQVYWSDYHPTAGAITETTIDGGPTTTLAASQDYPNHVVTDGAFVYWTTLGTIPNNYVDGAVHRMPLGGGPITTIASAQPYASGVIVDDTSIYWITSAAIMKAPK